MKKEETLLLKNNGVRKKKVPQEEQMYDMQQEMDAVCGEEPWLPDETGKI